MPSKKKKSKYNLKSKITSQLRKLWRYSPGRVACLKRCETGTYYVVIAKKSKKSYKRPYLRCEQCKTVHEKLQIDHIEPVVDLKFGFQGWDIYIVRLFVDETKLRGLCKACHDCVSLIQRTQRKLNKKIDKSSK